MKVEVRNNNVDKALRILKKKLQQDGFFNELREREYFVKPSLKKKLIKDKAIRRLKKQKDNDE